MSQTIILSSAQRRAILRSANQPQKNIRIELIPGIALAPQTSGRSYHWTTPAGVPVQYPNAYSRAFGRPVYHASTRRVIVGEIWAAQAAV